MRRLAFALLVGVFAVGVAVADDEVKKDVKKGAQETKEAVKEGAQETKEAAKEGASEVKAGAKEAKREVKEALNKAGGTVKSVTSSGFVVTDDTGKDLTFEVDRLTVVKAKGASHKMDALKSDGKPAALTEFLSEGQRVNIRYSDSDGRMVAQEIRVRP